LELLSNSFNSPPSERWHGEPGKVFLKKEIEKVMVMEEGRSFNGRKKIPNHIGISD